MRVVVIGAGVIGLTTAYFLRRRGHEVTVIERRPAPGLETSFANGGLLTPSMSEPWNAPGSWRTLLGSTGRFDAPLQVRLKELPSLAGWGLRFLLNSRTAAFERNTVSNLRLALHSLRAMDSLRRETGFDYGREVPGTLKLFRDWQALARAASWAECLSAHGLSYRLLSASQTVAIEPALAPVEKQLSGAIRHEVDEIGDAHRFCLGMAGEAANRGVKFQFSTEVSSLEARSGAVTAVHTAKGRWVADVYIVAACSYSTLLLRGITETVPVRPAKGYSVTFNRDPGKPELGIPLVDDDLHIAVVPIGNAIRIAGTAEFGGYDLSLPPLRLVGLARLIRQLLPQQNWDLSRAQSWCGLRAMSADGVPLIGPTALPNLFVNTGHGHLGWTMAAGSAQLLADLVCGTPPFLDPTAYDPRR